MTRQQPRDCHEPLYDIIPGTGVGIEVFFSDRTMESFGRVGAGWFWWRRRRGCSPEGAAIGPFPTSYAAYRHALGAALGASINHLGKSEMEPVG